MAHVANHGPASSLTPTARQTSIKMVDEAVHEEHDDRTVVTASFEVQILYYKPNGERAKA
jgi:hypothetical protein